MEQDLEKQLIRLMADVEIVKERTVFMSESYQQMSGMPALISTMTRDLADIKYEMKNTYVTKDQFDPVRKLVYGLVTLVLSGVVISVLTVVVK